MNIITYLAFTTYLAVILSLIWARFRFFTSHPNQLTVWVRLYDPIVGIQILVSLYMFSSSTEHSNIATFACLLLLILSLSLFWWSIHTAKNLDFAFSKNVGKLITSGPYALVRHPFYVSYILVWTSTTILFNSVFLWITFLYLVTFYFMSARDEEKAILSSEHSKEYFEYRQRVAMFIPRISKWKS